MLPNAVVIATRLAFQVIAQNKLRSVLTMLGAIIGVTCVVALWNIGESARTFMEDATTIIGPNVIFVRPKHAGDEEEQLRFRYKPMTLKDVEHARRECPSITAICPMIWTWARVVHGTRNTYATIYGCFPNYLNIQDYRLSQGTMFTQLECEANAPVAVLGADASKNLFGGMNPVGQRIRIEDSVFRVIGVLASKGSFFGENQDNRILIPFGCAATELGVGDNIHVLFASVASRDHIEKGKQELRMALRRSLGITAHRPDTFEMKDMGEWLEKMDSLVKAVTGLLGAIAAISLIVGGIGIMNIMLVSVTERTREIGLRMALGAKDLHIMTQFLVEATLMSGLGGAIGCGLGLGVGQVAVHLIGENIKQSWTFAVNPLSLVVALLFSLAIGIMFGIYPAWRASRLDPMEALRHA